MVEQKCLRVVSLVGARPQFVKVAPVHHELVSRGIEHHIIHSGQHYDEAMSDSFFSDLRLPPPTINLEIGSGSHAAQTAGIIQRLDDALNDLQPQVVLVYGDTNTTLAGALVVAKRSEFLVHIEAGLRSFNRTMPEEINRVLVDHAAHLLLVPTQHAMQHLANEGLQQRSVLVGDVMVDALEFMKKIVEQQPPLMPTGWASSSEVVFATLHRAENSDNKERLEYLIGQLSNYSLPVRLAAHPRLVSRMKEFGITVSGNLSLWQPLSYPQTVAAVLQAGLVVTDSGGLQKEAVLLGRPCLTARYETEWTETVDAGWNLLDPLLTTSPQEWMGRQRVPLARSVFGDGRTAHHIVDALLERYPQTYE